MMAVLGVKHISVCWVRYSRLCCQRMKAGSQKETCLAAWESNAAVDSERGTQAALRVVRHGQESSEAYLPKETQALSQPYLDLRSLLAGVLREHSRSASLAMRAQGGVREAALWNSPRSLS